MSPINATHSSSTSTNMDKNALRIVLLGPPASGKGTQAEKIKDRYKLAHLATGDMLREAAARGTAVGKEAKLHMDKGQLVPDDLIIAIVEEAIRDPQCEHGFILDGFPRTTNQAEKIDQMLKMEGLGVSAVLDLQIDDDLLVHRVLGRLIHPPSGRTYHEEFCPPNVPMTDDITGEPLIKRSDDTEEALKRRLANYHNLTSPISECYSKQHMLYKIDASKSTNDVWTQIMEAIEKAKSQVLA